MYRIRCLRKKNRIGHIRRYISVMHRDANFIIVCYADWFIILHDGNRCRLPHNTEKWICELDWIVDGFREGNYHGSRWEWCVVLVQAA